METTIMAYIRIIIWSEPGAQKDEPPDKCLEKAGSCCLPVEGTAVRNREIKRASEIK